MGWFNHQLGKITPLPFCHTSSLERHAFPKIPFWQIFWNRPLAPLSPEKKKWWVFFPILTPIKVLNWKSGPKDLRYAEPSLFDTCKCSFLECLSTSCWFPTSLEHWKTSEGCNFLHDYLVYWYYRYYPGNSRSAFLSQNGNLPKKNNQYIAECRDTGCFCPGSPWNTQKTSECCFVLRYGCVSMILCSSSTPSMSVDLPFGPNKKSTTGFSRSWGNLPDIHSWEI